MFRVFILLILIVGVASAEECKDMICTSTGCKCLENETKEVQNFNCTDSIYYLYENKTTAELYIGGYIFFPKTLADRIKVSGGLIEKENDCGWWIKVVQNAVVINFVKLSDSDFIYSSRSFNAGEFPKELYKPVEPDELRIKLIQINETILEFQRELKSIKSEVKTIAQKPTFREELEGFLLYFPPMWIVYSFIGVFAFLALLGWWYARD